MQPSLCVLHLLEHYGIDKGYLMCEVDLFPQVAVKLT